MADRTSTVPNFAIPVDTSPITVTHVLNRLSFGSRSGDRHRVQSMGLDAYIQEQLHPQTLAEPQHLTQRIQSLETQSTSALELFQQQQQLEQDGKAATQQLRQQVIKETTQTRLLRAIDSPRQLQEVMVDFWFNHFNVFLYKGNLSLWLGSYEQDVIRTHALGNFRTLLAATAKHPAMLFYLDNWRNTDPNSSGAVGPYKGLNENYARELMELHTLGVDGGYSQADVESLARILTGWSVIKPGQTSLNEYGFFFAHNRHDNGKKGFLGTSIAPSGIDEGELALDLLAYHPSTARHISFKLAQYFVSDQPPTSLVEDLATEFQATEGDIAKVLWRLFTHSEFWAEEHQQTKFRTPYQYVMAIARTIGLTDPSTSILDNLKGTLYNLQMPLYQCRPPDGYAQTQDKWLSPDAVLRRINVVNRLAKTYRAELADVEGVMATIHHQFSDQSQVAIQAAPPRLKAALVLGSPEVMYR